MGVYSFVKAGKQLFNTIKGVGPKVNKTRLDTAKSKLAKSSQKLKGATAKLKQTQFEIKNKLPLTFNRTNKKTLSNTEKAKLRNDESKKAFKAAEGKTKHYYVPENFNKGGRVGLKRGGGKFPDHSGDGKITKKDILMAKGVIPKPKKSKSPMDKQVRKA